AVERHAAVALLLCAVEVTRHVGHAQQRVIEVAQLRLHFLDAKHVRLLCCNPVEPALAEGRADAVQVECDDPYHRVFVRIPVGSCRAGAPLREAPDSLRAAHFQGKSLSDDLRAQFIRFSVQAGILRFGEFRTKAGRLSPYFFNAGLFNDGALLGRLAGFYADTLLAAEAEGRLQCDMLFGPAYKGITLASATAVALAARGHNRSFAFNRKEAKDHGEGGNLVGAPLSGRVVIVDDVISAGTSVRESVELIRGAGAEPAGVLIALDRMERAGDADRV